MSDLAVISQPGALDQFADPGAFVISSCERAKEWLTNCIAHGEIETIVEIKSQAEAVRVYTTAKQLGRDSELAAAEIVRRAERGIGLCIRKGQDEGVFRRAGQTGPQPPYERKGVLVAGSDRGAVPDGNPGSPKSFFSGGKDMNETYQITDVPDEVFEAALTEAKAEGNLSRANLVRAVVRKKAGDADATNRVEEARTLAETGHSSAQIATALGYGSIEGVRKFLARHGIEVPADAVMTRSKKRLDSNRIVNATVEAVIGIGTMHDAITWADLDRSQCDYWVSSLNEAIRSLTTLRNNLKELTQ